MRLLISAAPTEFGVSEAPMTATDLGRNILSRLRTDMQLSGIPVSPTETITPSIHGAIDPDQKMRMPGHVGPGIQNTEAARPQQRT
jgi:hypothetical protein